MEKAQAGGRAAASAAGGGQVIFRTPAYLDGCFKAPHNLTFAYQPARNELCIWYHSEAPFECTYKVVVTGEPFEDFAELVATAIAGDGFHVAHLVRLKEDAK